MNKPVYLGLSILELSKILMYEFWYDYVKPKYGEKAKLCYNLNLKILKLFRSNSNENKVNHIEKQKINIDGVKKKS